MTVRMVAPEPMNNGVIQGVEYKFQKDDKWGCVVDAHEAHIDVFRALGFKPVSEMPHTAAVEFNTEAPAPVSAPALTDEEIKAEKEAADKKAAELAAATAADAKSK